MGRLRKTWQGHNKIALDSNLFIYFFEGSAMAERLRDELFTPIEQGELRAVTSVLTVSEILTRPKSLAREDICQKYIVLLESFPNLEIIPFTLKEAVHSAAIRAKYRVRTPDAIQLATALEHGATLFFTNDLNLPSQLEALRIVFLKELLG